MQGIFLVTCLNILSRHTLLEKNALSNFTAIASTKPIIGDIVRNSVNCRFEVPHLRYSPKVMKTKKLFYYYYYRYSYSYSYYHFFKQQN